MRKPLDWASVMVSEREPGPDGEVNEYFDNEVMLDGTEAEARRFLAQMLRDSRAAGGAPERMLDIEGDTFPRVYKDGGGAACYVRFWIEGGRYRATS